MSLLLCIKNRTPNNYQDNGARELTADKGQSIQSIPPGIADLDRFSLILFLLGTHAQVIGVLDDLLHVVIVHSVRHIPEVCAIGQSALSSLIRHV